MKTENKPKISVVMAVYNEPLNWITESIESILNQTFRDFEFIIINDNPERKDLQDFLERWRKKDKRIILIKNKKNSGPAVARNRGLKISRGEYIAIMDADDISLPKRFEIQYKYLEKYQHIFLVAGSYTYINEIGKEIENRIININEQKMITSLERKNVIHNPTVMFRREEEVSLYREKLKYAHDYDLWLRFLSKGKRMVVLPKIILYYKIHENSITSTKNKKQLLFVRKSKQFYLERKRGDRDSYNLFNPSKINILYEKTLKGKSFIRRKELSLFFKNKDDMKEFRVKLKKYWKRYGFFNWKFGLIGYFISFAPKFARNIVRKRVWGI